MVVFAHMQAGKAALVAEESAVSAANLARAARTQAALGAAMLAAQAYNQVRPSPVSASVFWLGSLAAVQPLPNSDLLQEEGCSNSHELAKAQQACLSQHLGKSIILQIGLPRLLRSHLSALSWR